MENKIKKEKGEQYRIVIQKEASDCLEKMLFKVTNGFDAGSVCKSDIASWLVINAANAFGDSEVKAIQKLHFDERKILGLILRSSKVQNNIPEAVRQAIREHFGLTEIQPKRRNSDRVAVE